MEPDQRNTARLEIKCQFVPHPVRRAFHQKTLITPIHKWVKYEHKDRSRTHHGLELAWFIFPSNSEQVDWHTGQHDSQTDERLGRRIQDREDTEGNIDQQIQDGEKDRQLCGGDGIDQKKTPMKPWELLGPHDFQLFFSTIRVNWSDEK